MSSVVPTSSASFPSSVNGHRVSLYWLFQQSMQPCSQVWTPHLPQLHPSTAKLLAEQVSSHTARNTRSNWHRRHTNDTHLFDKDVTSIPSVSPNLQVVSSRIAILSSELVVNRSDTLTVSASAASRLSSWCVTLHLMHFRVLSAAGESWCLSRVVPPWTSFPSLVGNEEMKIRVTLNAATTGVSI